MKIWRKTVPITKVRKKIGLKIEKVKAARTSPTVLGLPRSKLDRISSARGHPGDPTVACFSLPDDIFLTLQLTIICYETKESVRKKIRA